MRNKFLKMTFMALCLSTSSALHAMNDEDGASYSSAVKPALELDTHEFHMGESNPFPSSGFSAFEGTHRWTVGKNASVSFTDMTPRPSRVSFLNTAGYVTGSHPQDLTVKVNGKVVDHHVYKPGDNNHTIDVALPKDGPAEIKFEIPNAISPSVLVGTNPDKRELGILFREVQLHY
jgi:hypothetical protein